MSIFTEKIAESGINVDHAFAGTGCLDFRLPVPVSLLKLPIPSADCMLSGFLFSSHFIYFSVYGVVRQTKLATCLLVREH